MELAKRPLVRRSGAIPHDHQEVAVAMEIGRSKRERAGQVRADEVIHEDRVSLSHELQ